MKAVVSLVAVCLVVAALSACARKAPPKEKGALDEQTQAPTAKAAHWGYVGGKVVTRADAEVKNTPDKALYLTEHYSMTAYRIPLANGNYAVKLHFAETYDKIDAPGQRVFTVAVEGKPVLADLDVFQEAGKQRLAAVVRDCEVEVADGELTIEFTPKVQNAMINAIEVRAKRAGRATGAALLINCGAEQDYEAKDGRIWRKDQEYQGIPPT